MNWAVLKALTRLLLYVPGLVLTVLLSAGYLLLLYLEAPMILTLMLYRVPASLPSLSFALPFLAFGSLPWTGFLLRAALVSRPKNGEDLLNPEGPRLLLLLGAGVFLLFGLLMGDALALAACVTPWAALTGDCLDKWLESGSAREVQGAVALNLLCLFMALVVGMPLILRTFPALSSALLSILPWGFFMTLFGLASSSVKAKRISVQNKGNKQARCQKTDSFFSI